MISIKYSYILECLDKGTGHLVAKIKIVRNFLTQSQTNWKDRLTLRIAKQIGFYAYDPETQTLYQIGVGILRFVGYDNGVPTFAYNRIRRLSGDRSDTFLNLTRDTDVIVHFDEKDIVIR
jgi:hypothetical protein